MIRRNFLVLNALLVLACQVLPVRAGAFPAWAEAVLQETQLLVPPDDTDMWRILDQTVIEPGPKGKIKVKRRVVQRVINEQGVAAASMYLIDGNADTTKIKRLKGWHRNSLNRVATLDRQNIVTVSQAEIDKLSHDEATIAVFEKVGPNSIVAFESYEIRETLFPQDLVFMLGHFPIAKRIIDVRLPTAQITPTHFDAWGLTPTINDNSLTLLQTPAIQSEPLVPDSPLSLPHIIINFQDPEAATIPLDQWSTLAAWYYETFAAASAAPQKVHALSDLAILAPIYNQQIDTITYRQRYLTPARGWVPASGEEVQRRKYGDCKDMVAGLRYQAGHAGVSVLPVLATVFREEYPNQDAPVSFATFNHLIGAIPLTHSLGLAAEVSVGTQRYLLVDPTAKGTPLGRLPDAFRNRHLLLCLPDDGRWVAVPEQAFEEQKLDAKVMGSVDENNTLTGGIIFTSRGNALGLRDASDVPDLEEVEWAIRQGFDIPGSAILNVAPLQSPTSDQIQIICQVQWPSFIRYDADGYRLPTAIVPLKKRVLEKRGRPRQQAIRVPRLTPTTWHITIKNHQALAPGATHTEWSDGTRWFSWQAEAGPHLNVTFFQKGHTRIFTKQELAAGLAYWENYRNNYNPFYREATLFRAIHP